MAKIDNLTDFLEFTSNITSFSHAYLFNVNSLSLSLDYAKTFAKQIILSSKFDDKDNEDICYKIDHDSFDDLYIVNPSSIGINTDEINKLLNYMETKSFRKNGKRVYIIYGMERLSREVSNKILKFLEEPSDNIYAILLTENYYKILPTIISRCQVFNFTFPIGEYNGDLIKLMINFISDLCNKKFMMIAYEFNFFNDALKDRSLLHNYFEVIERILSESLNVKTNFEYDELYRCDSLSELSLSQIIDMLDLTDKYKNLIKSNINLNLLIDRYIIEITEVLNLCKK